MWSERRGPASATLSPRNRPGSTSRDGKLLVKALKQWKQQHSPVRPGRIDRRADRDAGRLGRPGNRGDGGVSLRGRLGECWFKAGIGDIQLDRTGPLHLETGSGDITVDRATGWVGLQVGELRSV
jgi:hypothetical protein